MVPCPRTAPVREKAPPARPPRGRSAHRARAVGSSGCPARSPASEESQTRQGALTPERLLDPQLPVVLPHPDALGRHAPAEGSFVFVEVRPRHVSDLDLSCDLAARRPPRTPNRRRAGAP